MTPFLTTFFHFCLPVWRRDGTGADVISVSPHQRDREGEDAPAVVSPSGSSDCLSALFNTSIIYFPTFNPPRKGSPPSCVCVSLTSVQPFLKKIAMLILFTFSRPDIPDDEAQYWTSKLERINTMQIHDEVSLQ